MFVLRVPAPVAQARPEPWGMAAEEQAQGSLIPIDHGRHQAAVIVGVEHPHAHACRTEPLDRITRTSTVVIRESSIRVTTDRVPTGDPSLSDAPLRSDQSLKPRAPRGETCYSTATWIEPTTSGCGGLWYRRSREIGFEQRRRLRRVAGH